MLLAVAGVVKFIFWRNTHNHIALFDIAQPAPVLSPQARRQANKYGHNLQMESYQGKYC
jgi:hypothetical protein